MEEVWPGRGAGQCLAREGQVEQRSEWGASCVHVSGAPEQARGLQGSTLQGNGTHWDPQGAEDTGQG